MTTCGDLWVSNIMFRCPPPSVDKETGETMFLVLKSGGPDYSLPSSRHKTTAIGDDRPRDEGKHIDMTLFTAVTTVSVILHVREAVLFLRWSRKLHAVRLSLYLLHLSFSARS